MHASAGWGVSYWSACAAILASANSCPGACWQSSAMFRSLPQFLQSGVQRDLPDADDEGLGPNA